MVCYADTPDFTYHLSSINMNSFLIQLFLINISG